MELETSQKISRLLKTLKKTDFEVFQEGKFELTNVDKFIVSNDKEYHCDWKEILYSQKLNSMKTLNAYINMSLSPVCLERSDIQDFFSDQTDPSINFSFNVFNTGVHEYLKTPGVFKENEKNNLLNLLPAPKCCDNEFSKANFKNSVIFTSKGFLTTVHRDVDTPGTNIVHLSKGRKIWIFLNNLESNIELTSLEQFMDEISSQRSKAVVIDMVAGQTISFPMAAPHIVLTVENSIMPYWTFLSTNEIDWLKGNGYWNYVLSQNDFLFSLDLGQKPDLQVIANHTCSKTGKNIGFTLGLQLMNSLILDLQRLKESVVKETLSNVIYSFNDIIFYVWKIISLSKISSNFHKNVRTRDIFTDEQLVLFNNNGLNEKCVTAAYYCAKCIHEILKFNAGLIQKLEFGIKRHEWVINALNFLSETAPTMFPMLQNIPDNQITSTNYEADKYRFIHVHLTLITYRLLTNDDMTTFHRFQNTEIRQALDVCEQTLYYKRLLVPVVNISQTLKPAAAEEDENNIFQLYQEINSDPTTADILEQCKSYLKNLSMKETKKRKR